MANDRFMFYGKKDRVFELACNLVLMLDEADVDDYLKNGDQSYPAYGHYEYSEDSNPEYGRLHLWGSQKRIHFDWLMEMFEDIEGMYYIEDEGVFKCFYTGIGEAAIRSKEIVCYGKEVADRMNDWIRAESGEPAVNNFKLGKVLMKG